MSNKSAIVVILTLLATPAAAQVNCNDTGLSLSERQRCRALTTRDPALCNSPSMSLQERSRCRWETELQRERAR